MDKRVSVQNRSESFYNDYGKVGGDYETVKTIWANCAFTRGTKAMREGRLEAYEVYMVRCDYHAELARDSRLVFDGKTYQITSLNADKCVNETQIICQEMLK